jgi:hypothetical protein
LRKIPSSFERPACFHAVKERIQYTAGIMLLILFSPVAVSFAIPLIRLIVARLLDEEKFLKANLDRQVEDSQMIRYHLVSFLW